MGCIGFIVITIDITILKLYKNKEESKKSLQLFLSMSFSCCKVMFCFVLYCFFVLNQPMLPLHLKYSTGSCWAQGKVLIL